MNEQKLDPEFKTKWVAALRSGKYKQGKYALYNSKIDTFCCIGVAGKIKGIELCSMDNKTNLDDKVYSSCLSLRSELMSTLVSMNDGIVGPVKSFSEIADWIEENL